MINEILYKHPEYNIYYSKKNNKIYSKCVNGFSESHIYSSYSYSNRYPRIKLYIYGSPLKGVHIIIWECYNNKIKDINKVIHHIDKNKSNFHISNLQCVTRKEHAKLHSIY